MATESVRWSVRRHQEGRGGDTVYTGEIMIPGEWFKVTNAYGAPVFPGAPRGQSFLKVQSAPASHPQLAPASPGQALAQAGSLAKDIMGNPLVQAALPPGAGVAVAAIDYLAQNETVGNLANAAKDIVGDGAKRIADVLKFW